MEVVFAEHYGFCPGVKRVVGLLNELLKEHRKVYVYGQLIHNNQFADRMKDKGMIVVDSLMEIPEGSIVLTRAHGILKNDMETLKSMQVANNVKFIDGSCPFVNAVHLKADELLKEGYQVLVIGDKNHPEVRAALSYIKDSLVVETVEDIESIKDRLFERIGIVTQTTQSSVNIEAIRKKLVEIGIKDIKIVDTRCGATEKRQKAAKKLAENVDVVIVIGGKHSANTKRLVNICSQIKPTYHIETKADIRPEWFVFSDGSKMKKVGITAGASTPDWVIQEVVEYVKEI